VVGAKRRPPEAYDRFIMSAAANSSATVQLLLHLGPGRDSRTVSELFGRHRERLRKLIRLRLDWRLRGKVSSSTILDQVYIDVCKQIDRFDQNAGGSFHLWLREIVGKRLEQIHREHLGDPGLDIKRELHLQRGALPEVTAASMAAQLLGDRAANQSAVRSNMLRLLEGALNGMDAVDREMIALRNFEELTADEAATVLGMSKTAATIRHLQAVKKLNEILASVPGFFAGRE
jgi:RNA polymerase sigma-70 factor (ECF subfamily)